MDRPEERPAQTLQRLVNGFQVAQAIAVAARLGVADLLGDGSRPVGELAAATGADPDALYRLLRALASVGVFREEAGRRFALTPMGDCLRADVRDSLAAWVAYRGQPHIWRAWMELEHSVRTGEAAFPRVHGVDLWDYQARHPAAGAVFDRAMADLARGATAALLDACDFGRFAAVVDVGGGRGALLAAVLGRHPHLRGVLLDRPEVVAEAGPTLAAAGVAGRCRVVAGSFFEAVPAGGDAYVLRSILHDWDDGRAAAILRVVRRAMADAGTLLIVERELGPPNAAPDGKFSDLNMLVALGGRERTRDEWSALLAAAGFRLTGVTPTAGPWSVVEGRPA
jgi:hypothetical protein